MSDFNIRPPVETAYAVPLEGNEENDVRLCQDTLEMYRFFNGKWEKPAEPMIVPDSIGEVIRRPEFRGLWKSRTVNSQEELEEGWSITFVRDGDDLDLPYSKTPEEAAVLALKALGVHEVGTCEPGDDMCEKCRASYMDYLDRQTL